MARAVHTALILMHCGFGEISSGAVSFAGAEGMCIVF